MVADRLLCEQCGAVIPNPARPGVAEWVEGLKIARKGGGANQIRAYRSLGRWLCHQCAAGFDERTNTLTPPMF